MNVACLGVVCHHPSGYVYAPTRAVARHPHEKDLNRVGNPSPNPNSESSPLSHENRRSRLHNKLPVFKTVVEPDRFPLISNNGFQAFQSPNSIKEKVNRNVHLENLQPGGEEYEDCGDVPVFNSKLEEILYKFKKRAGSSSPNKNNIGGQNVRKTGNGYSLGRIPGAQTGTSGFNRINSNKEIINLNAKSMDASITRKQGAQTERSGFNWTHSNKETINLNAKSMDDSMNVILDWINRNPNESFESTNNSDDSQKLGLGESKFSGFRLQATKDNSVGSQSISSQPHGWRQKKEGSGKSWTQSSSSSIGSKSSPRLTKKASVTAKRQSSVSKSDGTVLHDAKQLMKTEEVETFGLLGEDRVDSTIKDDVAEKNSAVLIKREEVETFGLLGENRVDSRIKDDVTKKKSAVLAEDVEYGSIDLGAENGPSQSPDMSSSIAYEDVNISTIGSSEGTESCNVADWHKHTLSDIPFDFQYSYSETPQAPVVRYREIPFSPFGPSSMERPWTGRAPLKPSKKKLPEFDSFNLPPRGKKGIKFIQAPGPYPEGLGPKPSKSREEIMGEPLTAEEIADLVSKCQRENRQLNLGRDGLTHNMLDLIHCHWKRRRVCKIKCIGVPTVDMYNLCFHVEHKTGGKIIYRTGGIIYLFRGRNYNYKDRPKIPLMLWKPVTPVYPRLIQEAPCGLSKEEADKLRDLGEKVEPICRLGKNGVYLTLVEDVRAAFVVDDLVRVDCQGLNPSDYKKIGAKLRDLVPCVLLSFDNEQILIWKGKPNDVSDTSDEAVLMSSSSGNAMSKDKQATVDRITLMRENDCCVSKGDAYTNSTTSWNTDSGVASIASFSTEESGMFVHDAGGSHVSYMDSLCEEPMKGDNFLTEDKETPDEAELEMRSVSPDYVLFEKQPRDPTVVVHSAQYSQAKASDSMGASSFVQNPDINSKQESTGKEKRKSHHIFRQLNVLWDEAIVSGMAVQLDDADLNCDSVAKRASELAESAPVGPKYTEALIKLLRVRNGEVTKTADGVETYLGRLNSSRKRNKSRKQSFLLHKVDVSQSGGLPVDDLAKLLSAN